MVVVALVVVISICGCIPACVHVDCAGPVRENIPSHSLLSEGLTGENNRLKRGLKCGAELLRSRQPFAVGEAAPRADPRHRIAPSTFTVKVDPSRLTATRIDSKARFVVASIA